MATATERRGEGALGQQAREGCRMVQRLQCCTTARVVRAAFDADDALSNRRQRQVEVELLGDVVRNAEPFEAGAREQDCVELALVEAPQARIDVAAQQLELQVRSRVPQLRL